MLESGLHPSMEARMGPEALASYKKLMFKDRFWALVSVLGFGAFLTGLLSFPENAPIEWPTSGYTSLGGLVVGFGAMWLSASAHNESLRLLPHMPEWEEDAD